MLITESSVYMHGHSAVPGNFLVLPIVEINFFFNLLIWITYIVYLYV